jgi:myo-inositol-1(or 4)-monophosphatase
VIAPKSHAASLDQQGLTAIGGQGLPLLLRLTGIAEGALAGAVSAGSKYDWDIAAGHLILEEAGGVISTLSGAQMIYNSPQPWQPGLIAAAPQWHQLILDCMRKI